MQDLDTEEYRAVLKKEIELLKRERYRREPLFWLQDRLKENPQSFAWSTIIGYEGHKWDGDIDPLASAWQDVADVWRGIQKGEPFPYRNIAIESATGTSKTYWLARLCLWFLDCWDNSLIVTSAPKQDQLKLGLWSEIGMVMHKFKKLRPDSELYKLRLAVDERGSKELDEDEMITSDSWHCVGFVAGVGAEEQSANKARGFHRKNMLIICEEATGMPLPVLTAFQNTCTGAHNIIVAVGNPDNEFDPLHQLTTQKNVKSYRISAFDYPNIVLNKELFSGAVTWASINDRKDVYGEGSQLYEAMVRGISPTQSEDSLIRLEWIEACVGLEVDNSTGYNAVGVDVSNSEAGDKAALAWGKGNTLVRLEDFFCKNATHLAYNLFMEPIDLQMKGYVDYHTAKIFDFDIQGDCIGVDAVGVGVATINALVDSGYRCQSLQGGQWDEAIPKEHSKTISDKKDLKPLYRFQNLRSQMYWQLREDLRHKEISLALVDHSILTRLKKELVLPKFDTRNNTVAVESKDNIKKRMGGKSPNLMDAVVYWNWCRHGYRVSKLNFMNISAGD